MFAMPAYAANTVTGVDPLASPATPTAVLLDVNVDQDTRGIGFSYEFQLGTLTSLTVDSVVVPGTELATRRIVSTGALTGNVFLAGRTGADDLATGAYPGFVELWITPDGGDATAGSLDICGVAPWSSNVIFVDNTPAAVRLLGDCASTSITIQAGVVCNVLVTCPDNTYEGGGVAMLVSATLNVGTDTGTTIRLIDMLKGGVSTAPVNDPDTAYVGGEGSNNDSMFFAWETAPGEAGTWDIVFEAYNAEGDVDTCSHQVVVGTPNADHVAWNYKHIEYSTGVGAIAEQISVLNITGADSTFGIVMPFLFTPLGAIDFDQEIDEPADITLNPAFAAPVFESASLNDFGQTAPGPQNLLVGLIDFGGPALDPGTYDPSYTLDITLTEAEGILMVDSTTHPPANELSFNTTFTYDNFDGVNDGVVTPTFSPGCYLVTIVRNICPDVVTCPESYVGPVVFGQTVTIPGFGYNDPDNAPGPWTFKVVSIKNGGVDSLPVNTPTFTGDTFEWVTTADDQDVGLWEFCVTVNDGNCDAEDPTGAPVTCCFEVEVIGEIPLALFTIGCLDSVFNGASVCVPVTLDNQVAKSIGGFDLLITYDPTFLTFLNVNVGQALIDCDWEYFTYRLEGPNPSLIRLIAIADMNNSADHPDCYLEQGGVLFELCFRVTNDRNAGCLKTPIQFYWYDCGDNTASNKIGDTLYAITDPWGVNPWFPSGKTWPGGGVRSGPEDDAVQLGTFFGGITGPPGDELCGTFEFHPADQPEHTLYIDYNCYPCDGWKTPIDENLAFVNGCIKIICPGDIDDRGDLNMNGFAYEIADAVLYSNYFILGPAVFTISLEGQIAASDVNADGIPLTVADLVYLIRVVAGDAEPIGDDLLQGGGAKIAAGTLDVTAVTQGTHLTVNTSSESDLGAGLFVFQYEDAEILSVSAVGRASEMDVNYRAEEGELRVLLYNIEDGAKVEAGAGEILSISTTGGSIELVEVEAATFMGGALESSVSAKVLPTSYALHQNYPNPFNPTTSLAIDFPTAGAYRLTIYNITGQVVKTYAGHAQAGTKTITWSGVDNRGAKVASGVYFYSVEAGDFRAVKKMVLMK
jgi:hypothetical protein